LLSFVLFFLTFDFINAQTTTTLAVDALTGCESFVLYFSRCTKPLDVIFLLDSSSSISSDDYLIYKTWLADSIFQLVPETTRIAVAQFSTLLTIEFQLDAYEINDETEADALARFENYQAEIMALQRLGGLTRTQYALQQTRLNMWNLADPNRNHLTVIVTDGRPSFGQDPCVELEVYKEMGIDFTLIGIGAEVAQYIDTFCADQEILAEVQENMILISDFSELYGAEENIGNLLCPAGTLFDGYYDVGSSTTWRNGRPTYGSVTQTPPIYVYFDGNQWVFETGLSNAEVLGFTNDGDDSLWPTAVMDWQYTDESGDVFVYSGGNLVQGDTECVSEPYTLYTLGGTVSGLPGDSTVDVVLSLGDADTTATASGNFQFSLALPDGFNYGVTIPVQPTGYICTVTNGNGVLTSNTNDIVVDCAEIYDIIGTATNIPEPITITNGGDSVTISADGAWSLVDILDDGEAYNLQVAAQPDGYTCVITPNSGSANAADVTNVSVICQPTVIEEDYDISGSVTGLSGSVTLTNGGDSVVVSEDSPNWTIVDTVAHGSGYDISVSENPPGYTCEVSSGATGTATGDVTGVSVSCTQDQYTVGGTSVTIPYGGLTDGAITISLNGEFITIPGGSSIFEFPGTLVYNDDFEVNIVNYPPGQDCVVVNGVQVVTGNIDNIQIICTATTHTVGGEANTIPVSGLSDGIVQISLNGGDPVSISGDSASFDFDEELTYGDNYQVTIVTQPVGQTCVISNGSGRVTGDVTDVAIDCTLHEHTVSGTSSTIVTPGLSDGVIELSLNGNTPIEVAGGDSTFTFPNTVTFGDTYEVTIAQQPVGQTCVLEGGTGRVTTGFGTTAGDISDVTVTCTGNEHTISGSVSGLDGSAFTDTVSVTISNSNGDVVEITEGSSSFTLPSTVTFGEDYSISVSEQPNGYQCSVINGDGTVNGDVTNVAIVCSESGLVELGGTYSSTVMDGLTTGDLIIEANGISVNLPGGENNDFNLGEILRFNEPYSVVVTSNPTGQTCTVINGSGTAFDVDILDVQIDCSLNQYVVSGDVSGLEPGQTVTISNGEDTITVDDNFSFPTTVEFGSGYGVTITDEPDGVDCQLLNPSGTVTGAVNDIVVICDVVEVFVGGQSETFPITGLTSGDITLVLNGDEEITVPGGTSGFSFTTPFTYGDSYEVTVGEQPPGQTCTVENGSGTITDVDVSNLSINCVEHEYSISGVVIGLDATEWLPSVSAIMRNTETGEAVILRQTTENVALNRPVLYGETFNLVMLTQPTGHTCVIDPASGTVTGNIDDIAMTCTKNMVDVGGLSSSLVIDGLTDGEIVLALNGEQASLNLNGGANNGFNFEDALSYNQPYEITIVDNPDGQTCSINSAATGVATTVDISSVLIACSANPYTVGGVVTGLENGQGAVTLELGGTEITTSGAFTFPEIIDFGQPYSSAIVSQPDDYNCEITNSGGVVAGDVSNIVVTCIAHPTTSPSGVPSVSPSRHPVTPGPSVSPSESPIATPHPSYNPSISPVFSMCNPYDVYQETRIDEPTASITSLVAGSIEHCGNLCRESLDICDAFQYNLNTGACILFQTGEEGVHDNVNFVYGHEGYVSGWGRCDFERADHCQLSYGNISRVEKPHFYIHEAGFNPEDPNALRFLVEVHPSYFDILLAFDNATNCGSNYTVELDYPFTGECDSTRWKAVARLNGSSYCDNELYQLDVPFWDFVVGGEGGVRVMESYTDEFGTVHDDPNYYYLGFIITMDAKQPLRQQVADSYGIRVWEEIRDVFDAVPMVIRLERTAQASTAVVVFLGDYEYITVGAVVEHVSVVNNYGFQPFGTPYGISTFDVRTRSQYPYMFLQTDGKTTIALDRTTAKTLNGILQTSTASIKWTGEEGVCEWVEGNPWSDVCDQLWEITVEPDYCYIDGDYVVTFQATCFRNKTCEIPDGATSFISMTFRLESSTFCPVVVDDVGLQGTLYFTGTQNYEREDRSYAIFADDTVYFRSEVYSPESVIQNSTLISITATWEQGGSSTTVKIWDDEETKDDIGLVPYYPSKFAPLENIDLMPFDYEHIVHLSPKENGFSFVVDRRIFPVPMDAHGTLTVTCTVAITYEGGLSSRRRLTARRQMQNDYLPQTPAGDMNLKISGPAIGVSKESIFFPYDESHIHKGSVHFYIQIRLQKDIMARNRLDAGKLLHVLRSVILEFAQITEDGFNLDRVDACEPQIMRPGHSSWRECDQLFADNTLLGTDADYMPLSRTGLHYVDKNVLQIWGTFLQSTRHQEPMRNWNFLKNALVDTESPFYGTSLFHSSTLVEAQARDAARPVVEESSSSQLWVFINVLTIFTMVFTI